LSISTPSVVEIIRATEASIAALARNIQFDAAVGTVKILWKKALGRLSIASTLHKGVEDTAVLVDGC
jgi:hypothetical protein